MILLVGFTIMSNEEGKTIEPVNTENINTVNSIENATVDNSLVNYVNEGKMTASWYGPRFHGRLTANGEIYNQMALTAASKTMKFGTLLKITNLKNDKFVIVRINDRGPYIHGRQLDLSKGAAIKLGMIPRGVIKVKVEQLKLKGVNFPVITLN